MKKRKANNLGIPDEGEPFVNEDSGAVDFEEVDPLFDI